MKFIAEITVMPLKELLNPQGKAVLHGLNNLGLKEIADVRIGKHIRLRMEADSLEKANETAGVACKKLLANPVMEYFDFKVYEEGKEF